MYECFLKCCIHHRASRSFIDVPYMMCLTNLSFSMCVTSMAGACSIWVVLPAYTLQVRLFGDPHLPKHSPKCESFGFVSRCFERRRCKIASAAYTPESQCLTKLICGGLSRASFASSHNLSARLVGIIRFQSTNNTFQEDVNTSYNWLT